MALVLALTGCSSAEVQEETLTIDGSVFTVPDIANAAGGWADVEPESPLVDGGECWAADGYDDIAEGGQVTIKDSKGEIVAIGQLSGGIQTGSEGYNKEDSWSYELAICAFSYSIAVGNENRGQITYEESELSEPVEFEIVSD
jgi:hypothetical protein